MAEPLVEADPGQLLELRFEEPEALVEGLREAALLAADDLGDERLADRRADDGRAVPTFVTQALVAPAFLPAADYQKVVDAERVIFVRVVPKLSLTNN